MQLTGDPTTGRRRPLVPRAALPALLILSTMLLVSACGLTDGLRATVGLPTSESTPAEDVAPALPDPDAGDPRAQMTVTAQQRGYLDALAAAGVRPSSDLLALSIGSSVCQARAARQTDQAVWDFVAPLVRGDVRATGLDGGGDAGGPDAYDAPRADLDTITTDYIRIATERLC